MHSIKNQRLQDANTPNYAPIMTWRIQEDKKLKQREKNKNWKKLVFPESGVIMPPPCSVFSTQTSPIKKTVKEELRTQEKLGSKNSPPSLAVQSNKNKSENSQKLNIHQEEHNQQKLDLRRYEKSCKESIGDKLSNVINNEKWGKIYSEYPYFGFNFNFSSIQFNSKDFPI